MKDNQIIWSIELQKGRVVVGNGAQQVNGWNKKLVPEWKCSITCWRCNSWAKWRPALRASSSLSLRWASVSCRSRSFSFSSSEWRSAASSSFLSASAFVWNTTHWEHQLASTGLVGINEQSNWSNGHLEEVGVLGVLLLQRLDLGVVELLDGRPLPAQLVLLPPVVLLLLGFTARLLVHPPLSLALHLGLPLTHSSFSFPSIIFNNCSDWKIQGLK